MARLALGRSLASAQQGIKNLIERTVADAIDITDVGTLVNPNLMTVDVSDAIDVSDSVTAIVSNDPLPYMTGLVAFYRASLGVTESGGAVSAWNDQSGTGDSNKNATQGTGSAQPTYVSSDAEFNNRATISGDGGDFLETGTWAASLAQACTVFVVCKRDSGAVAYAVDGLAETFGIASVSGYSAMLGPSMIYNTPDWSTPSVVVGEFNGASGKLYNSALTAIQTGDVGSGGATGLTLFADNTQLSNLVGTIAEIIVYDHILSTGNRTAVMNFLGTYYGITIGA